MNIAKFTKNFFIFMAGMLVVAILARIYMMEDNDYLSELHATDNAIAAYSENKKAFNSHKVAEKLSNDGYYSANGFIYNEEKKELQVTARYNDSLYDYLDTEVGTKFSYTIVDISDDTVYEGEILEFGEKYIYNYDKLVFENVDITESSELYLFLHFEDKYPVEGETDGLILHYAGQELKTYKLSKDEKAALTEK